MSDPILAGSRKRPLGWACFALYVGTVFVANWAVARWGVVPVLPSIGGHATLYAPAAVYAVGFAFTLRDLVQDGLGRRWTIAAILLGAGASYFVAGSALAFASGVAFLTSELADFAVYTPLKERGWLRAVTASNVVGLVVDSVLFLWLAFGSLAFLPGQIVAKAYMTALAVALLGGVRAVLPRESHAELAR